MKKLTLLVLTLFITISVSYSQQGLFVRVGGSANSSKSSLLPGNKREFLNASRVAGYNASAGYRSEICKFLSFEHELQFSREGLEYKAENQKTELKLYYLKYSHLASIPICGNFNLLMGPSVSYKLGEQVRQNNSEFIDSAGPDSKKNFDFGINFGLRFNVNNLHVFARAYQAVINTTNITFTDQNGDEIPTKEFNHNVQIGAGYTF